MMLHSKHSRKQMKKTVDGVRISRIEVYNQREALRLTWHSKDVRHLDAATQLFVQ